MQSELYPYGFCDVVMLRSTPETRALSIDEKPALIQGKTRPSLMPELCIIGSEESDITYHLFFEETGLELWVAPELFDMLDPNVGAIIQIDDRKWTKVEADKWLDHAENKIYQGWDLDEVFTRYMEKREALRILSENELSRMIVREQNRSNNHHTYAGLLFGILLVALLLYYFFMLS